VANVTAKVSDLSGNILLANVVTLAFYEGDRRMEIDLGMDEPLSVTESISDPEKPDAKPKEITRPLTVGEFVALATDRGAKRGRKTGH